MHHSRVFQWRGAARSLGRARTIDAVRPASRWLLIVFAITLSTVALGMATDVVKSPVTPPLPPMTPVAQILSDATTWRGAQLDPLITLPSGVTVKSSNYQGIRIGDTTYYYDVRPSPSFDPLSRGVVDERQIHVVAVVGDPPRRLMIYTIEPK